MSTKMKLGCIGVVVLFAMGVMLTQPPIPQAAACHAFADDAAWWGIVNAQNVLSNMAFVIAGLIGLMKVGRLPKSAVTSMWRFFFSAVVLVGLGSGYYHWLPSNNTLVWDRLPMTLCFSALTACVCAERLGVKFGQRLFVPLVISGVFSVFYWWLSEQHGFGDLRPYIVVQYLPMVLIPLMLLLFPKTPRQDRPYWLLLASYIIAKGFELNDGLIFNLTNEVISGHTLKHLAAAAGIMLLPPTISTEVSKDEEVKTIFPKRFLTKKELL
ncbi:ceramidase domain-containing protein [Sporomusa sp.]|uniref:ceramidase domain-containing protein n=1 Tax=Sporomusa sp. TaxID=2078658 RepID=UPI002D04CF28|nr:ceramidase domain-containing protein [Sporomusa sp.]HWR41903.1 ceramidase domain-containing protein [Sporomusa sp.]